MKKLLVKLLAGVMMLGSMAVLQAASAAESPISIPKAKRSAVAGDWKCVEDTDVMRRDHMEFILHQRDETMYKGIRGAKHSLVECVECHSQDDAKGNPIPINSQGEFCQTCHEYAAVSIDCFSCHRTTPLDSNGQASAGHLSRDTFIPLAELKGPNR
jgi:hypothetical protein